MRHPLRTAGMLLLLSTLLSGCALLPDMQLDRDQAFLSEESEEAIGTIGDIRFELIPITPSLVTRLDSPTSPTPAFQRGGHPVPVTEIDLYEYRIRPRDILSVTVWDHPELTIPAGEYRSAEAAGQLVREDGTIFYPYAGIIRVSGMTLEEVRKLIAVRLEPLIQNPQVDVRVVSFRSQRVYVTGQVAQPGVLPVTDVPLSVLDAINTVGGFGEEADRSTAYLLRDGRRYPINLVALYDRGDVTQNYLLKDGDVLHIPDNLDNKVFVLGEVGQQRPVYLHRGRLTLSDAIAEVGGIDPISGDARSVYVVRGRPDTEGFEPRVYLLDARSATSMLLADAFPLQSRDVVFVSTAPISRWNRVLSQLLPSSEAIWDGRREATR